MKFEFTDSISKDTWIEEYPSLAHVPPEDLEGCTYQMIFNCNGCKKEVKTNDVAQVTIGLCENCDRAMDDHIEGGDCDAE